MYPEGATDEKAKFKVKVYPKIPVWDGWAWVIDFNTSYESMRRLSIYVKEFLGMDKESGMNLMAGDKTDKSKP